VANDHSDDTVDDSAGGKGRPTPRRKDREAELKRPLVSNNRKESKARLLAQRERARLGLANGEERFLPQRDKGPQRKWARDYVDSRFNFGEFLIPVMFAVILATFLPSVEAQIVSISVLWGFFLLTVLDSIWVGNRVRKGLREKYGIDNVQSGVRWYAAMRALQMRGLRLPKAQVKRGEKPS
jgi:hypothetical protein